MRVFYMMPFLSFEKPEWDVDRNYLKKLYLKCKLLSLSHNSVNPALFCSFWAGIVA